MPAHASTATASGHRVRSRDSRRAPHSRADLFTNDQPYELSYHGGDFQTDYFGGRAAATGLLYLAAVSPLSERLFMLMPDRIARRALPDIRNCRSATLTWGFHPKLGHDACRVDFEDGNPEPYSVWLEEAATGFRTDFSQDGWTLTIVPERGRNVELPCRLLLDDCV